MHDPTHPLYLPLRLLHILGAIAFVGGLATALYWKLAADRTRDAAFAALVHLRIRRADAHIVGPGALVTFAAGYVMVRALGGRIAQHGFVLWGLILMFAALGLWFFVMRPTGDKLAAEADALHKNAAPLGRTYATLSVKWLASAALAVALVVTVVFFMVFQLPSP